MINQIQKTLQGIKDLHIKILQSNNLPEISHYLQEILDKIIPATPDKNIKTEGKHLMDLSKARIIHMLKSDIKSIVDGTYNRLEIAKYQATLNITWLNKLIKESFAQKGF